MGRAYSMYERNEKSITNYRQGTSKEGATWDKRVILKLIVAKQCLKMLTGLNWLMFGTN